MRLSSGAADNVHTRMALLTGLMMARTMSSISQTKVEAPLV